MLWRSVAAFVALPGTVAFLVPMVLAPRDPGAPSVPGVGLVVLGTCLLLWCVREFHVVGKGTLAPWAPPAHLVRTGLYRVSRNPMYIAVALVLFGWALTFRSGLLLLYAVAVTVVFHGQVVLVEEPRLARAHGDEWARYKDEVPRWLP